MRMHSQVISRYYVHGSSSLYIIGRKLNIHHIQLYLKSMVSKSISFLVNECVLSQTCVGKSLPALPDEKSIYEVFLKL